MGGVIYLNKKKRPATLPLPTVSTIISRLLDYAQFFTHLDKGCDSLIQMFLFVSS